MNIQQRPEAVYRIVAFSVPEVALAEFLARAGAMQSLVRSQPGFLDTQVFQRVAGPGRIDVVSMAAWSDEASIDAASRAVAAHDEETGFDRPAYLARLGVTAEVATFRPISL
jgi:heme-degrading monooxygenase HmoA